MARNAQNNFTQFSLTKNTQIFKKSTEKLIFFALTLFTTLMAMRFACWAIVWNVTLRVGFSGGKSEKLDF